MIYKKENFAWIGDTGLEKKMVNVMKKGSRIMITGYNQSGSQTIDHYSLMGFTKAYNTAQKKVALNILNEKKQKNCFSLLRRT